MKLFLIICGFYPEDPVHHAYEQHEQFLLTAENIQEAHQKVKSLPPFRDKKMHVDGIMEIQQVEGYRIVLEPTGSGETVVLSFNYDDLKKGRMSV